MFTHSKNRLGFSSLVILLVLGLVITGGITYVTTTQTSSDIIKPPPQDTNTTSTSTPTTTSTPITTSTPETPPPPKEATTTPPVDSRPDSSTPYTPTSTEDDIDENTADIPIDTDDVPKDDAIAITDNFCGGKYWSECDGGKEFSCQDGRGICVTRVGTALEERAIDLRSVVALKCFYENPDGGRASTRGSGVFVSSKGFILTNRHVVDQEYTQSVTGEISSIDSSYKLEHCEVRHFPKERAITLSDAQYINFRLDEHTDSDAYDWKAHLVYMPQTENLSRVEESVLDYAVLKITDKNTEKHTQEGKPPIIPAPMLLPSIEEWQVNIMGERTLVPGYSVQGPTEDDKTQYDTYNLNANIAKVVGVFTGDRNLKNKIIVLQTESNPSTEQGRSGSPIFYKGYVLGIFRGFQIKDEAEGYLSETGHQVAINGILDNLGARAGEVFDEISGFGDED